MKRKRETLFTPSPKQPPKLNFNMEKTLSERFRSPRKRPKLDFNLAVGLFDSAPDSTAPDLQNKLNAAMHHANSVCRLGASNKMVDIYHTNGWSWGQRLHHNGRFLNKKTIPYTQRDVDTNIHYSEKLVEDDMLIREFSDIERWDWYYHQDLPENADPELYNPPIPIEKEVLNIIPYFEDKDPLNDSAFNLSPENKELLNIAILVKDMRFGNCGFRSILVMDWLWRHSTGIKRLEYIGFSFDHACVFVNREDDSMDTGWVIDSWWEDGKIYPVSEFMEKMPGISNYCKKQTRERLELLDMVYEESNEALGFEVLNEIQPEIDKYPSYDPNISVGDYYYTSNIYPVDIVPQLGKLQETHKQQFKAVLSELNVHAKAIQQNRFFSQKKHEKTNESNNQLLCSVL